jgi:hypothetical protein
MATDHLATASMRLQFPASDGRCMYRVGDRWKPANDHAGWVLIDGLRLVLNACAVDFGALETPAPADAKRLVEQLEREAAEKWT